MPGTRSAPTVDGTPTYKKISLRWIDYTGDLRTDSYQVDAATTDLEVEAFAAASQALSNASLYDVTVGQVYSSPASPGNALEDVWENATDNVVLQAKNATNDSIRAYIPSPIEAMFVDGTDNINTAYTEFVTWQSAFEAMLPAGYSSVGVRFTSRRQINQQQRI